MIGDRHGFVAGGGTISVTRTPIASVVLFSLLTFFFIAGCGGTEKSKFYTLSPMTRLTPQDQHGVANGPAIGVGPVHIPEYLNRYQIVTRLSKYKVDVAEFDRWAATLETNIVRVIAENLSNLLSTDRIYTYPWHSSDSFEYQTEIDIIQFDGGIPGNVELLARWTLLKGGIKTRVHMKKSYYKIPIPGQGYPGLVSAMSLILHDLCREMADAVLLEEKDEITFEK